MRRLLAITLEKGVTACYATYEALCKKLSYNPDHPGWAEVRLPRKYRAIELISTIGDHIDRIALMLDPTV